MVYVRFDINSSRFYSHLKSFCSKSKLQENSHVFASDPTVIEIVIPSFPWTINKKFEVLRVSAYKNRPKSPISGTSRKIDFACILPIDRS